MEDMGMISLGEGATPLLALPWLAQYCGLDHVWAKAEWLNPTGSYKDRIAAETIKDAIRRGNRGWVGTSSGNGGAAMSAYGARAGLPGFLCVAADAPKEKLQSILPYGTTLIPMTQIGIREMDEIGKLSVEYNLKLAVTAYRYNEEGMAGAEEIGKELLEQGSFSQIYVPTGGGGLLVAITRGIGESTSTSAKIVCAQPVGCGPIASYVEGELSTPTVDTCNSMISGLQLTVPPDGYLAADAVRRTNGWGCLVSDEDTWEIQDLLARREGIFVEPASALALAAIVNDSRNGRLTKSDCPVAILTGSGLKDLRRFTPVATKVSRLMDLSDLRTSLESAFK